MSSNFEMQLVCEYCKKEFTAKTTRTRFCSHNCARKSHKDKVRAGKIQAALHRNEQLLNPSKPVSDISKIQTKDLLTLNETAALLHISPLTCRRWLKDGKIISSRIGKKHIFRRVYINELVSQRSEQINNQ